MVELSTRKWEIGGNHHEKLGLREFCVRVNWPCPIRQVRVPIQLELTPISGHRNPIRQVVPLISLFRSYPPYHSHLHPPSLSFSSTTQPSLQNTKLSHPSLSLHDMIMSWHRVQHTPSTASTQDCLSSLHSHDYELTPECSFSFRRTSLHDRPPLASSAWEPQGKVTLSHSHGCELTHWWIESRHQARRPLTASKYSSNLTWSRPPMASPNSLDYGLQVHLQTRPVTASKCNSKLAWSQPPSASPNSLDRSLQVYLQSPSITASKCISKLAQSQQRSVSPNSLDYGLQVHLQTRSVTASKCISKLTWSRPPSASPNSLDHSLQVYLQTRLITASKCISKLAQSQPPSVSPNLLDYGLQVRTITAFKCISELTRSWPPSASLSSINHGLQVHISTRSITASKYIINEWRQVFVDSGVTEA